MWKSLQLQSQQIDDSISSIQSDKNVVAESGELQCFLCTYSEEKANR